MSIGEYLLFPLFVFSFPLILINTGGYHGDPLQDLQAPKPDKSTFREKKMLDQ